MSFTPGPWEVRQRFYVAIPDDPFSLAEVKSCQTVPADQTDIHEANARLIAAAPDLLAACEAKLAAMKGKEYDPAAFDEAVRLCEEAIVKATGETN